MGVSWPQQSLLATQRSRLRPVFVPFWCKTRRFTLNDPVPDPWGTHSPPVGNTVSTGGERDQYPWGTRSVPVGNVISTRGEHDQYPWGTRSVPVGNVISTRGERGQYPWGTRSVPVGNTVSTGGERGHRPRGKLLIRGQRQPSDGPFPVPAPSPAHKVN